MSLSAADASFEAKVHSTTAVVLSCLLKALCIITPDELANRVEAQMSQDTQALVEECNKKEEEYK